MLMASDVLVGSANSPMVERRPVDRSMIMQAAVIAAQAANPVPLAPEAVAADGVSKGANFISPTIEAELFRAHRGLRPTPTQS